MLLSRKSRASPKAGKLEVREREGEKYKEEEGGKEKREKGEHVLCPSGSQNNPLPQEFVIVWQNSHNFLGLNVMKIFVREPQCSV